MITELTPAQKYQLGQYAVLWAKWEADTGPLTRHRAKAAIELAYEVAGQPKPTKFVWLESPLALRICAAQVMDSHELLLDPVNSTLYSEAWTNCLGLVNSSVWNEIHNEFMSFQTIPDHYKIWQSTWDSVIPQTIWSGLSDSLWEADLGGLWDALSLEKSYNLAALAGSMDAGLRIYSFFREFCGLKAETSKLEGLLAVAQECGWWIPFSGLVLVSPKPLNIQSDLIRYEDGFEVHF